MTNKPLESDVDQACGRRGSVADRWRGIVARQARSGLGPVDFCRSEGIPQSSFFAWRRKLGGEAATAAAAQAPAVGSVGFARVTLKAEATRGIAAPDGPNAALELRRDKSAPILETFERRLHAWRDQLVPKHPMAQAIGYTLNQWRELGVFAKDGAVPIDNNTSEREMKRIVLNRKNSLFVGHEQAGRTAAILSSLTSTCRRHAINPQLYLTQLLANLPATPLSQLDQWLPDQWKHNQPTQEA